MNLPWGKPDLASALMVGERVLIHAFAGEDEDAIWKGVAPCKKGLEDKVLNSQRQQQQ